MAGDTNNQSITTYIAKKAAQDSAHPEYTPSLDDVVYVTHGTGSDRDRFYTLEQIGDLLLGGSGLSEIELKKALVGGGYKVVTIDGESMEFSQYGGSSPDGTATEVTMMGVKTSITNQGYETFAEMNRDGLTVSYGPTEGTKEKTEVLYNKVRTKAIEGTSAGTGSASAKELVIASGLHVSNSGGSQYLKVDGLAEFNGNSYFNGDVVIGDTLHYKDVHAYGKVSKAKYVLDANVIDADDANLIAFADDDAYDVGEIVLVHNSSTTAKQVYFAYIGGPAYVEIKPKCTIPFRCVTAGRGNWQWSPLCNIDYTVETQSNEP